MKPTCRHCRRKPVSRPRRLCWSCYYQPAIQDLYPVPSRGVGLDNREPPPPVVPTAARPGSPEKVAVLASRAAAGVGLWHERDGNQDTKGEAA